MRCYICDWSPDTTSDYHSQLELNHYTAANQDKDGIPGLKSLGTNKGKPYNSPNVIFYNDDGKPICRHCSYYGQGDDPEWGDVVCTESHLEDLEEVET